MPTTPLRRIHQCRTPRKIIAAFAEANAEGRGVTVVDGRLVENLHVEAARRTLMIHAMIEEMETETLDDHAA